MKKIWIGILILFVLISLGFVWNWKQETDLAARLIVTLERENTGLTGLPSWNVDNADVYGILEWKGKSYVLADGDALVFVQVKQGEDVLLLETAASLPALHAQDTFCVVNVGGTPQFYEIFAMEKKSSLSSMAVEADCDLVLAVHGLFETVVYYARAL
jgi:hypothetical protein